jgi:hypothetical protein
MPVHDGSVSARTWARMVLVASALLAAVVIAFNAVVDPTAQLGTGLLEPIAAGPRDRVAKVELFDRDQMPPVVVLGSSRTKKLDPAWLGASDGVNAAVVGGDLFEARVLAAWIAELTQDRWSGYPQLVVGVDVEQLRDSSLQGSGFLAVPQLEAIARREAAGADGSLAGELDRLERLLLTAQVTKASAASLRARLSKGATARAGQDGGDAVGADQFTATGVAIDDARWQQPAIARGRAARTAGAIEANVAALEGTYRANGSRLDADAIADLQALARIVRDAGGPPPLLYLTPAHPRAIEGLAPLGREARREGVLRLLRSLERSNLAAVIDCERCIDDADTSWIDATHPSPLGMQQLAARLSGALPLR